MTRCQICKEGSFEPVIREGEWQYFRCKGCGLVFLHPQPSFAYLNAHYQEYLPSAPDEIEAWRRLMVQVFEKSASLIESHISSPGRLLDVGCGYGFFLECMAFRGWKVHGIEISATARNYARESLALDVSPNPLPRPDWPDASHDVVTLFYVIEHLPNPIEIVREAHRLLRPGGLLLLRWPHTTPIAGLLKPWASTLKLYQAPSHLFDFSPKTIHKMLRCVGFQEIRTTICGWTRPGSRGERIASILSGGMGEMLAVLSKDRWLLPGVSKTTLATRGI